MLDRMALAPAPNLWLLLVLFALLMGGCGPASEVLHDFDGDGSIDQDDCGPDNPDVYPGARVDEYGDGLDSNCDGNDGIDNDGDGFPAPGAGVPAELEDCNDSNASIHPEAIEIPADGVDQNCDNIGGSSASGAPTVTISPIYPRTDDDLVATVVWEFGDTSLGWFKDGVEEPNLTSLAAVPASATVRGQVWRVVVVAEVDGEPRESEASVTISNSLPFSASVAVSPATGTVLDTFSCAGSHTDADQDVLSLSYRWFIDTVPIDATTAFITATDGLSRGDSLNCEITTHDGEGSGLPLLSSSSVLILNSAPTEPGVPTPDTATDAFAYDDLICEATTESSDADGDDLTYTMEWFEASFLTPRFTAQLLAGSLLELPLNATETRRGEQWTCQISASDGSLASSAVSSEVTTIINSPPTAPLISTDAGPSAIVTPVTNVACSINTASYDADGDAVSYHMEWLENSNPIIYENTNASVNDVLVLSAASYTDDGDRFTCVVTPNDGLEDGDDASEVVDICGDTRISLQNNADKVSIVASDISSYGPTGTIELWLWLRSQAHAKLFDHWTESQADVQLRLTDLGAVTVWILYSLSESPVYLESADNVIPTGEWLHIAMQWDSTTGSSLWVNGLEVASNATLMTPLSPSYFSTIYLGENWVRTAPHDGGFDGSVQNLRISDVVRYNGTFTPPLEFTVDPDTRALYRLAEGAGNGSDATGNGGAAVPSGAHLWQADQTCLNP